MEADVWEPTQRGHRHTQTSAHHNIIWGGKGRSLTIIVSRSGSVVDLGTYVRNPQIRCRDHVDDQDPLISLEHEGPWTGEGRNKVWGNQEWWLVVGGLSQEWWLVVGVLSQCAKPLPCHVRPLSPTLSVMINTQTDTNMKPKEPPRITQTHLPVQEDGVDTPLRLLLPQTSPHPGGAAEPPPKERGTSYGLQKVWIREGGQLQYHLCIMCGKRIE